MKTLHLLFATLFLLSGTDVFALDLTVMSFNVRYGSAEDGDNAWEHRKDILVDAIKTTNPDVLGTQECLDFQAEYIVEQLPEYGWIGLGRQVDGTGEMTAILYRKKALLPVEINHLWLSETPEIPGSKSWDSSLPRIASRVKFIHSATLTPFIFYNTHFDHKGEMARLESAKLLATHIQQETLPTILTGDFNAPGGVSAPWEALTQGGLQDAWEIATKKVGPANTWNGFETPAGDADRRIDWIIVTPGLLATQCTTLDTAYSGHYPSDHFPVFATISIPESTATGVPEE